MAAAAASDEALVRIGQSDALEAVFSSAGGELVGLAWEGMQLLHGGAMEKSELDASRAKETLGWQGRGLQLFPFVGRHRDAEYKLEDGRSGLKAPLHGFISEQVLSVGSIDSNSCKMEWDSGVSGAHVPAHADWPFKAQLTMQPVIEANKLTIRYRVHVPDSTSDSSSGKTECMVPFSMGNHISLAVDWAKTTTGSVAATVTAGSSTVRVAASRTDTPVLRELPLVSGGQVERAVALPPHFGAAEGATVPLSKMPLDGDDFLNAVIAFDSDPFVELTTSGSVTKPDAAVGQVEVSAVGATACCSVRVVNGHPLIRSSDSDATSTPEQAARAAEVARGCTLVFWGTPGAEIGDRGFVCPEPWMGVPDSMNTGIGAAKLAPGEVLEWWWSVETLV